MAPTVAKVEKRRSVLEERRPARIANARQQTMHYASRSRPGKVMGRLRSNSEAVAGLLSKLLRSSATSAKESQSTSQCLCERGMASCKCASAPFVFRAFSSPAQEGGVSASSNASVASASLEKSPLLLVIRPGCRDPRPVEPLHRAPADPPRSFSPPSPRFLTLKAAR
jgi:hypothetical protein